MGHLHSNLHIPQFKTQMQMLQHWVLQLLALQMLD
jgi:hypothetical protein